MLKIKYPLDITYQDYPDNYSIAVLVYFYGCIHNCFNCHNPELQNFNNGKRINVFKLLKYIYQTCKLNRTNKIVLSGGDPLNYRNIDTIKFVLNQLEKNNYEVCIYTGYSKDYIIANNIKGFKYVKCGKYDECLFQLSEKTDDYLKFASSNQELYDNNLNLISRNGIFYFDKEI